MLTEEMKLTRYCQLNASTFWVEVPMTQSQEDPDTRIELGSHKESLEDKEELEELTASEPSSSSPKLKTKRSKFFKDILARMSKRYGYMFCHMRQSFMLKKDMEAISNAVHATLKKVVPPMVDKTTNDIVKKNLSKNKRESIRAELSMQVSNDVANVVPLQIKDDKQARDVDLTIWLALKYKYANIVPHIKPYRVTVVRARDYEDHHDDARPKGESSAKRQKTFEHRTYTRDNQGIDDDEVPSEEVSPELLAKNGNKETRKYVPSLHKIHAFSFLENDLEELNTRWVKKIIKRFDLYAIYAIDHWKNPRAQQAHIRRKLKTRDVTPLKYMAAE
ncbi:hypothetical protein Tco_1118548 [Tanacetum coccineum]